MQLVAMATTIAALLVVSVLPHLLPDKPAP